MEEKDTVQNILDSAQALVQRRGYNAFSYKDVSLEVGVRGASIHYHFPTKADLGVALVRRYRNYVEVQLKRIREQGGDAPEQLRQFVKLYQSVVTEDGRLCLNCMLAADFPTLPESVAAEVRYSLECNAVWLERVFAQGSAEGTLQFRRSASEEAHAFLAGIEGGMLLARAYGTPRAFETLALGAVMALEV